MSAQKWRLPLWGAALILSCGLAVRTAPTGAADVCTDVGGRHVSVGGCADPGASPGSPPQDGAPPNDSVPPQPDVDACASVGRRVSVGGCT
ncbi:RNA-binding protein [Mycobacterium shigaense]|uniref:RNA-binding protein n=1 Tax=Mycobacterium shigaense TaxID=722731 RepID=UPI002ADF1838|nr:RNA-binding protein [Mycobacterium shigaense]MEA1122015.1 RNA-binding protein [Mycobacterium shigaense]